MYLYLYWLELTHTHTNMDARAHPRTYGHIRSILLNVLAISSCLFAIFFMPIRLQLWSSSQFLTDGSERSQHFSFRVGAYVRFVSIFIQLNCDLACKKAWCSSNEGRIILTVYAPILDNIFFTSRCIKWSDLDEACVKAVFKVKTDISRLLS